MPFIEILLGNMFSYVTPGGKLRLGIKINKFHDCNMVNTDSWLTGFIRMTMMSKIVDLCSDNNLEP